MTTYADRKVTDQRSVELVDFFPLLSRISQPDMTAATANVES
jgi:hypothetical protein